MTLLISDWQMAQCDIHGMLFIAAIFFLMTQALFLLICNLYYSFWCHCLPCICVIAIWHTKKRVLKVNCVPIFYSFKTPKKRRQMPSWVVACYKQLNQSLLRDFLYKLMLANLWVYTVWILTCKEKQDMYVFLHYDICKVQ